MVSVWKALPGVDRSWEKGSRNGQEHEPVSFPFGERLLKTYSEPGSMDIWSQGTEWTVQSRWAVWSQVSCGTDKHRTNRGICVLLRYYQIASTMAY